ncbi:putative UBX domain protein [Aspergillus avenaceus]|uniref:Putative UBX domain protein n=1 Tax=Aspergillus avenaceus TaxID=36643 RepID=A0A5N6TQL2_ASPAV|nr:putative UBX domain protein [Aspergillus avenaceus]
MSSHVVVLDSTARRATIKTTPGKYLTDVLQEACTKLGVDASQYGLKYKGKQVDLSLAFRLSGLTSGAKLELVQLSRSPSVVNVALQLPECESHGAPNGRLMDKFPSTTTLWLVLRKFEAGVAGSSLTRNLTARGVPVTGNGDGGAGRLFYEMPVVQIIGRELSTFTDLQKTLAQLGYNSGNVLLRLSFRRTDDPLEVAMVKIQEYFSSSDDTIPQNKEPSAPAEAMQAADQPNTPQEEESTQSTPDVPAPAPVMPEQPSETQTAPSPLPADSLEPTTVPSRSVTVFAPPANDTPQSAQTPFNENDYIPSVEHAQAHQRRLNIAHQNKRLPSDAEIAAKAAAEAEKLAAIKDVDVKVRLPDQSQVVAKFGQHDTGKSLYGFVRNCLAEPFAREKFIITQFPAPGPRTSSKGHQNVVPDSDQRLLIKDLNMAGRVMVNFSWDTSASSAARQARTDLLRPELRSKAQEHKVVQPPEVMDTSEDTVQPKSDRPDKPSGRKPGSLPKWLKLPGKK